MHTLRRAFGRILRHLTPAGRGLVGLGVLAGFGATVGGFAELAVIAWMCALLLLFALPFLLIPAPMRGHLLLRPSRTVVGGDGSCVLQVTNLGRLAVRNPVVRIPVGDRSTTVRMPVLKPGRVNETPLVVKGYRRGVLRVGPALARRGDPLGLLVREDYWARWVELLVRPRMVLLDPIGTGTSSDMEGAPSDQVSMNDLAFHALREYVRGDDLRHVHWRSSARAGELHVRQYQDSRRSRAVIVVDADRGSYRRTAAFETAMSVAASLIVRLCQDGYEVSLVAGASAPVSGQAEELLDATCRVGLGDGTLVQAAQSGLAALAGGGFVVLVTGDQNEDVDAARALFPPGIGVIGIRAGWRSRKARAGLDRNGLDRAGLDRAGLDRGKRKAGRPVTTAAVEQGAGDAPWLVTVRDLDSLPEAMRICTREGLTA